MAGWFPLFAPPASTTFTAQWQPMLLGDGGNAQGVHVFQSGTILSHVDTYNAFKYNGSTPTTIGAKTLATPAWQPMFRSDNISGQTALQFLASLNTGVGDIAEHPGNTNYFMAIVEGRIWISGDRGSTWAATSRTVTFATNAGPIQSQWIAGDPNDATGATWIVNTPSQGAFRTTNATSLGSATFTAISGVTASSTNGGGSVFFDRATSGGSQKIWISSDGIGVYECNSTASTCTLLNTAGMPTRTGVLVGDKFGQLWSGTGFYVSSFTASVYASGAWVSRTIANINANQYCTAIVFDPNTGGSVGSNQVIAVLSQGDLSCSLNNGASWTGVGNGTVTSTGNQAAWLGTATQSTTGVKQLNINGAGIDSSGNIWAAGGISIWTTVNPITSGVVAGSVNWAANSIGIEQLVVNGILAPPGGSPLSIMWDRGVVYNQNPDDFGLVQYPQLTDILDDGFGIDYAFASGSAVASGLIVAHVAGTNNYSAKSSNGGKTWAAWPTFPSGHGAGGTVAVSTSSCWACVPGNSGTAYQKIYCTPDAGANWYQATGFTGTPSFVPNNNRANGTGHVPIAADKTAGVFYAFDQANGRVYKSTNANTTSPTFSLIATPTLTGFNAAGKIKLSVVPGNPTDLFISGYPQSGSNIYKSTNSGVTWAIPAGASSKGFENISGYGFGAPKPGGSGYPTIYLVATTSGAPNPTLYYSTDAGATFNVLNVPVSQQTYPIGSMDYPTWVTGDPNVYGRVYYGWVGSGCAYIDIADACPWVNFSNTDPNAALSGTVTLTSRKSGLVPVTSVQYAVDGSNIGSAQTGAGPYSISWNASGIAPGAHILTVTATGANGTGSFSIPITTS
jgi:Big-like domain-containing protein